MIRGRVGQDRVASAGPPLGSLSTLMGRRSLRDLVPPYVFALSSKHLEKDMIATRRVLVWVMALGICSSAWAQDRPRIGYVFPAGGRQGTTFLVTVGGQFLGSWKGDYQIDVLQAQLLRGRHPSHPEKRPQVLDAERKRGAAGQTRATTEERLQGCRDLEGDVRDSEKAHPGPLRVYEKRGSAGPSRHPHGGGHLGCQCRARTARTAGGNAARGVQSLVVLRRPTARISWEGTGTHLRTAGLPPGPDSPAAQDRNTHYAAGRRERTDPAPRAGRAWAFAGAVHFRRCRPLPLRGPQGAATGHRRSGAGTHPVSGRCGSGLVSGHVGVVRRQGKRAGLRRRLPVPSRPRVVLQGPRRRTIHDRDQGRDLPRSSRFRLSHQPGRASLHYGRFSAGRPGRGGNHRQALRVEPADRHADDRRQGHDAGDTSAFGVARGR